VDAATTLAWLALIALMFLDSAMLLHFVPSLALIAGAILLVATGPAQLAWAVALMSAASLAGTCALFAAFRSGGRAFLLRHERFLHVRPDQVARLETLFARPLGEGLVLALRLVPYLRVVVAIPAGLAGMSWRRYLLLSAPGIVLFDAALAWGTYAARGAVAPMLARAWSVNGALLAAAAVALALVVVFAVRSRSHA
jgi:membrane protein DedA with SNARE-associated domain